MRSGQEQSFKGRTRPARTAGIVGESLNEPPNIDQVTRPGGKLIGLTRMLRTVDAYLNNVGGFSPAGDKNDVAIGAIAALADAGTNVNSAQNRHHPIENEQSRSIFPFEGSPRCVSIDHYGDVISPLGQDALKTSSATRF